ncbi:MAG: hypothetical protein FJ215_04570 [Ignavibacteria bacterium]|nr:hypothetical protein [Ignavibacteria bacterium]
MSKRSTGCELVRIEIPDYVSDRLGSAERQRVDAHLLTCQSCRSELEQVTRLFGVIDHAQATPPPTHYFDNLLPRIRSRMSRRPAVGIVGKALNSRWILPTAAALLVVSLLVSVPFLGDPDWSNDAREGTYAGDWNNLELLDLADQQSEHLPFSPMIIRQENIAHALGEKLITDQLADAVFAQSMFIETVPFSNVLAHEMLQEMSDEEINNVIHRLAERTLL